MNLIVAKRLNQILTIEGDSDLMVFEDKKMTLSEGINSMGDEDSITPFGVNFMLEYLFSESNDFKWANS